MRRNPPYYRYYHYGANQAGADYRQEYLKHAEFTDVTLTGANFMLADLTGANFTNAKMQNTNLLYATLDDTIMLNADLRGSLISMKSCDYLDLRLADLRKATLSGHFSSYAAMLNVKITGAKVDKTTNFDNFLNPARNATLHNECWELFVVLHQCCKKTWIETVRSYSYMKMLNEIENVSERLLFLPLYIADNMPQFFGFMKLILNILGELKTLELSHTQSSTGNDTDTILVYPAFLTLKSENDGQLAFTLDDKYDREIITRHPYFTEEFCAQVIQRLNKKHQDVLSRECPITCLRELNVRKKGDHYRFFTVTNPSFELEPTDNTSEKNGSIPRTVK